MMGLTVAFFIAAVWSYDVAQDKLQNWSRAEGTVVGFEHKRSGGSGRRGSRSTKHACFSFVSAEGLHYTVTSKAGSNFSKLKRGDTVEVLYPAAQPMDAVMNSFLDLYGLCLGFSAFAAVGAWVSAVNFYGLRRK